MSTVLMIGDQMISRLKSLHSVGLIHRDIKPDNITMGPIDKPTTLHLIDFGLSKKYKHKNKHLPPKKGQRICGTLRYCSIRTHLGKD